MPRVFGRPNMDRNACVDDARAQSVEREDSVPDRKVRSYLSYPSRVGRKSSGRKVPVPRASDSALTAVRWVRPRGPPPQPGIASGQCPCLAGAPLRLRGDGHRFPTGDGAPRASSSRWRRPRDTRCGTRGREAAGHQLPIPVLVAESRRAEFVVVGSRGLGELTGLLIGRGRVGSAVRILRSWWWAGDAGQGREGCGYVAARRGSRFPAERERARVRLRGRVVSWGTPGVGPGDNTSPRGAAVRARGRSVGAVAGRTAAGRATR